MKQMIKILKHNHAAKDIAQVDGSDWIDLYTAEEVYMKAGEYKEISLGVSMKLPEGYEAHVVPRSSTYRKWGVIQSNSMGVIDESYCGNNDVWKFPAIAIRPTHIPEGTRICQFRIMKKQGEIQFIKVAILEDKDRGGIGSTGEM